MKQIEGYLSSQNQKIAIVVARFNELITSKLLEGAVDCFKRHGGDLKYLTTIWVPGAFEIPIACQKTVSSNKYDGILTLGCIIRGATPHFDYVASEATKGISQVSLSATIPIGFGILTTESIEQAIERAGTKSGNKGASSMLNLIETIDALNKIV